MRNTISESRAYFPPESVEISTFLGESSFPPHSTTIVSKGFQTVQAPQFKI